MLPSKLYKAIIISSRGYNEHIDFCFGALPQLQDEEWVMTSQQLTMVKQSASSTATCNVIKVGLQNKKQRARYDHEKI